MEYKDRFYRKLVEPQKLVGFEICLKETDLHILAEKNLRDEALPIIRKYRSDIEKYGLKYPEFIKTFDPLSFDEDAPDIIKEMLKAGELAGVGPMAAVAGAVAEFVGKELSKFSKNIIVENGGDIYMQSDVERIISIFAADSPLSMKVGVKIPPCPNGYGVCTSSATVGKSVSFGKADAVAVLSQSASIADAAATAICNNVKNIKTINDGIETAQNIKGVDGVVIIIKDKMGVWGNINLIKIEN